MNDLVPFHQIGEDDIENYTPEQLEAASFLNKLDWEGGPYGLLYYGIQSFPEELREKASEVLEALDSLGAAIDRWAAERGVSY